MSASTDLQARNILERLVEALPGATVDYQAFDGTYRFAISRHNKTYRVVFAQQVLEETETAELERVLSRIRLKLLSERAPARIRVGPPGSAQ